MSPGQWSRPYPNVAVIDVRAEHGRGYRGQLVTSYRAEVA